MGSKRTIVVLLSLIVAALVAVPFIVFKVQNHAMIPLGIIAFGIAGMALLWPTKKRQA